MDRTEIAALVITCVLIVMDYLTGLAKSVVNKDIDSTKMRDGLWHKAAYVAVIVLAEIIEARTGGRGPGIRGASDRAHMRVHRADRNRINPGEPQSDQPELADSPVMQLFRSTKDAAGNGAKSGKGAE